MRRTTLTLVTLVLLACVVTGGYIAGQRSRASAQVLVSPAQTIAPAKVTHTRKRTGRKVTHDVPEVCSCCALRETDDADIVSRILAETQAADPNARIVSVSFDREVQTASGTRVNVQVTLTPDVRLPDPKSLPSMTAHGGPLARAPREY